MPAGPKRLHFSASAQNLAGAAVNSRSTVDVRAKVDLADVVVLQDGGVSGIRSVVGSTMVQGAAGGEGQAGVQPVLFYQFTGTILQTLTSSGGGGGAQNEWNKLRINKEYSADNVVS